METEELQHPENKLNRDQEYLYNLPFIDPCLPNIIPHAHSWDNYKQYLHADNKLSYEGTIKINKCLRKGNSKMEATNRQESKNYCLEISEMHYFLKRGFVKR